MARRIAVIPGDGVGQEVVPEGIKAIAALGLRFDFEAFPWGCEHYERTGRMMPEQALSILDAVCEDGRVLTADLGGNASTAEVGDAVVRALR